MTAATPTPDRMPGHLLVAVHALRDIHDSYDAGTAAHDMAHKALDEMGVVLPPRAPQDARPAPGDAGRLIDWAAKLIADAKRVGVDSESWHNERQDWLSAYKATPPVQPAPEQAAP